MGEEKKYLNANGHEKSCLITQNLIGAVDWFLQAPNSVIKPDKGGDGQKTWSQKAREDLVALVKREKTPFPEAAKKGVDFEKMVYKYANATEIPEKFSAEFKEICNAVRGFEFFKKGGKTLEIEGSKCYIYGKYDAIRLPEIIDIKTTASYSNGKYLKGIQHKLYCWITEADLFKYVIAEWAEYPVIKKVYTEVYVPDKSLLEDEIRSRISDTLSVIKDLELWDDYRSFYCLY